MKKQGFDYLIRSVLPKGLHRLSLQVSVIIVLVSGYFSFFAKNLDMDYVNVFRLVFILFACFFLYLLVDALATVVTLTKRCKVIEETAQFDAMVEDLRCGERIGDIIYGKMWFFSMKYGFLYKYSEIEGFTHKTNYYLLSPKMTVLLGKTSDGKQSVVQVHRGRKDKANVLLGDTYERVAKKNPDIIYV